MTLPSLFRHLLAASLLCLSVGSTAAHPIPDIPVRGSFASGGKATLFVDVNPRCFDADPTTATSLTRIQFSSLTDARKAELLKMATELVRRDVEFFLEPIGQIQPNFQFEFTGEGHRPLETDDAVVLIAGTWATTLPAGVTGWNIRSGAANKVSVVFENEINGVPHPRVAVLFPSERSYTLDLTQLTGAIPTGATRGSVPAEGGSGHLLSTIWSFAKQGFSHVVPDGLDHMLFVLGLFFLGRNWRPMLLQVSAFTLAHSATLALVTFGYISAPSRIIEPLIAATIAFVAFENLWKARYTHQRLLLVFAFGLVHGMGFASALADLSIPKGSLLAALGGFNLGVEGGQIAVISGAFLLTGGILDAQKFRRWVAVPGSVLIGLTGLFWAVQRLIQ